MDSSSWTSTTSSTSMSAANPTTASTTVTHNDEEGDSSRNNGEHWKKNANKTPEATDNADADNADAVLVICALQPELRSKTMSPKEAVQTTVNLMHRAAASVTEPKVDLFVLPELSPIGYSEDTFANYLPASPSVQQDLYEGMLHSKMQEAARALNAYICYGTIGWHGKNTNKKRKLQTDNNDDNCQEPPSNYINNNKDDEYDFTIRQVVVDRTGRTVATYDKLYPCDYGACAETRFFVPSPSQQAVSFEISTFRIGLLICADQRVPTLARTLAGPTHKVDVLVQPAAFYRDVSFVTWKSFRETRAVENSVYFVGVNYAGDKYGDTTCVPPWVDDDPSNPQSKTKSLKCEEGWLLCHIERSVLDRVRTEFPFYRILQRETAAAAGAAEI